MYCVILISFIACFNVQVSNPLPPLFSQIARKPIGLNAQKLAPFCAYIKPLVICKRAADNSQTCNAHTIDNALQYKQMQICGLALTSHTYPHNQAVNHNSSVQ